MPVSSIPSRRTALLSLAASGLGLCASPLLASQNHAVDDSASRRKINLAGRQRMLSQRMGRAVFFLALGVDKSRHHTLLASALRLFDDTLLALRFGSEHHGLPPEANPEVLDKLRAVEDDWDLFHKVVRDVVEREAVTDADIQYVAHFNLELLQTSNAVVKALVTNYGNKSTDMGLAIAIDVAGRQRMLSQKMAKEVAMVALGLSVDETCGALQKTIGLFDGSLSALMEGLPTITLPAPPPEIRNKLEQVRDLWLAYQKPVRFVADSGLASQIELGAVSAQADPLLVTMNEAVELYETV